MFRSGETLGLFTGNKGGHNEHFLKFSALYYFFPFQNLKFLDYGERSSLSNLIAGVFILREVIIVQPNSCRLHIERGREIFNGRAV